MPRCCLALFLLFSCSVSAQFSVVENATELSSDCVQLTAAMNSQRGAAWHDCTLDVAHPFTLELTVNLGSNDGGADGIAWVMQQIGPGALTSSNGGNMGYGNFYGASGFIEPVFDPSLVIEFDTWINGNVGDPFEDHVALQRDGTHNHNSPNCLAGAPPNTIPASATSGNIEDGQDHDVLIQWDPATQNFRMEFDGDERFSVTVDLVGDVFAGDSEVWWGFTGSTGGANNAQSFCLVDFSNPIGIPDLALSPAPPYALCPGEIGTITASAPGLTVSWEGLNSATLEATAGEYLLEADVNGCPQYQWVEVEALPAPNLAVATDAITICEGTPTVLTATADPGAALDWDGTGQATLAVSAGGVYTVVGTLATCTESLDVTVNVQTSPTVTVAPGPDVSLCEGDVIQVTASTDQAANISWSVNGLSTSEPTIEVSEVGLVQATAETGGCPGNTVTLDIEVLPLPSAEVSAIPEELCFGATGLVSAFPNAGSTITGWTLPSGTNAPNQAGPGLYIAQLESADGCTSTASLSLTELPPIDFTLDAPLGACNNEPVALEVSGNHDNAVWSTGDAGNQLLLTAADGPGPFTVTVSLGNCSASESASLDWWPVPVIGPLQDTVVHCVTAPPVEWTWPTQAEPPLGWWVWTVNDEVIPNGPAWETEGDFTVRIFDSMTGCEDTAHVVVDVWPTLDVEAVPLLGLICWGEETEVFAELRALEGTNLEEIPYTLEWSDPSVEGLQPTVPAGTYLLTAENACGADVTTVEVTQEYCGCDMWVPTAFTPDNDGINDGFRVESNCSELDEFQFQVFDRWGELVWETLDPEQPWMGQSEAGKAMEGQHFIPDGVYGYRIFWKYTETGIPVIEERRGHVHILR